MPPEDHCGSMKAFTLLCILSHVYSGDPLQNLLRDVILSVRSASERIISAMPISSSQGLMYQMDPKISQAIGSLTDFVNVCPPSTALPNMDGFWQITHISKQFLLGVFSEVEQLIDRVSSGGPTYIPKTMGDILKTEELPHCMALSILADPFPIPFEYSYGSSMGRKSVIGQLTTEDGRHLSLNFGGDVELRSSLIYASPSEDILVLADLDALPKCSNIMVMRRNQSFEGSHGLTAAVCILLTSGIWVAVYLTSRNGGAVTNYITNQYPVTNNNVNTYNNYNSGNTSNTCAQPSGAKCTDTCEFVICESIPAGLQFDPKYPIFNSTTSCWMRLMAEAQQEVLIGSYYWSLLVQDTGDGYTSDPTNTSGDGALIYDTLLSTAQRGINVRIAQTYQDGGYPETAKLEKLGNGTVQLRSLDFTQWYPGGILHTKTWVVDKKHYYVGSANFDWRSLTQVKELGVAAFNCPCLAEDVGRILEIYWQMGAPGAKIPQQWDSQYSALGNAQSSTSVPQPQGNQAVYFSASPPEFQSCGREDDLAAMIKAIDAAQDFINMAVMDYAPSTLYIANNFYFPDLDSAIRRAAFDRQVKIQFLLSYWAHTKLDSFSYMYSLQDLSDKLPCVYQNNTCVRKGSITVRIVEVPDMQYGAIPYGRVYHNKYLTTEKEAYVGTSNWSADYWLYTAGIGIAVRSDDSSQKSFLVNDLNQVFLRDWNSNYTMPLTAFTVDGKRKT